MIAPITPNGSCKQMLTVCGSNSLIVPSSERITLAKYRKWSTTKGKSAAMVSRMALPLSTVSTTASFAPSVMLLSILSAILFSRLLR